MYEVVVPDPVEKQILALGQTDRERVVLALEKLEQNPRPRGAAKLKARSAWRIRVGNYRIIYEIKDNKLTILILAVGHRREVYRKK